MVFPFDSQFVQRTDHPVGFYAPDFRFFDFEVAGKHRAFQSHDDGLSRIDVRGSANDLQDLVITHVDGADMQMVGIRMRNAGFYMSDHQMDRADHRFETFDFRTHQIELGG